MKEQVKRDISSFPFTRCHIEDCVFVKKIAGVNDYQMPSHVTGEIIALEVVFYQLDCSYIPLIQNPNPVNRMGTENYNLADYNNSTEKMTFENKPVNLMVDRSCNNYLSRKDIRKKLSYTYIKDAKVEYFLSRWRVNNKGCIMKVQQSESFVLKGKFTGHKNNLLHLELSDDLKLVYIVTYFDKDNE